jgi:hypothetical protein
LAFEGVGKEGFEDELSNCFLTRVFSFLLKNFIGFFDTLVLFKGCVRVESGLRLFFLKNFFLLVLPYLVLVFQTWSS